MFAYLNRKLTARRQPPAPAHHVVPLDDLFPARALDLEDTAATVELEHTARLTHAARIVHRALVAESLKPEELRNHELTDVLLDLRSTLRPSAPGSEVLREQPALGVRHAVPVIPGGVM